ncbi:MAG: CDP-alcohol phosphatidyltransferase family protein [Lachnospira sp.]|nr:CDP-alcohol phosphatidyltransferase family protein [Lachnospira sp.]
MKFKFEFADLFKLPNILCYLRIAMVPIFLYVYFAATDQFDYYMATAVVIISGITDFLDGQIARRFNMITDLGKLIDPIADKLMQLAMLVALTIRIRYMYVLIIYLVIKEVVSTLTGFFVYKVYARRLDGAKWYGKVCTFLLYAVMLVLVAFPQMEVHVQGILIAVCAGSFTLAFVMYMRQYIIMAIDAKKHRNDEVLY